MGRDTARVSKWLVTDDRFFVGAMKIASDVFELPSIGGATASISADSLPRVSQHRGSTRMVRL